MLESKQKEIRTFFEKNADPEIVKKYAKYFKEGYDGYGIDQKVFEKQRDIWIENWKDEMTLESYLELGDRLYKNGKLEDKSLATFFIQSKREYYSKNTFKHLGKWFDFGVDNWAACDVLCMLVLWCFLVDEVISFDELKSWNDSENEWQRRAVPVTLVELLKHDLKPQEAIDAVEPLMLDKSEYVQKGIGTLMRGLWKKYPEPIEAFLMKWKDQCGRIIIQYATEKMDKDYRKKFRRKK